MRSFELTPALLLFDFLHVEVVHGWLPDPETDKDIYNGLLELGSYNKVVEHIVGLGLELGVGVSYTTKQLSPTKESSVGEEATTEAEEGKETISDVTTEQTESQPAAPKCKTNTTDNLRVGELESVAMRQTEYNVNVAASLADFLSSSASQLTKYGLCTLKTLNEGLVCVLFRNNHFATLYRHLHDGHVYQLVTDIGYADVPEVVWERLVDVGGDTVLVNADFVQAFQTEQGEIPSHERPCTPHDVRQLEEE
jgi:hypothetical protein